MNQISKNWLDLRATGIGIRILSAETEEAYNTRLSRYTNADGEVDKRIQNALTFLRPYFTEEYPKQRINFAELKSKIAKSLSILGPSGHLALCELDSNVISGAVLSEIDLVVMFLHATFLREEDDTCRLVCTGTGEEAVEELLTFNSDDNYPEMFPKGWKFEEDNDFTFKYKIINKHSDESHEIFLRIHKSRNKVICHLDIEMPSNPQIVFTLNHGDFLTPTTTFLDSFKTIATSLDASNSGFGRLFPRAAASTLSIQVREKLFLAMVSHLGPANPRQNSHVNTRRRESRELPVPIRPPEPHIPMIPRPRRPEVPGIIPGLYGDGDLYGGGGGNLLGPGHPQFNPIRPELSPPGGHPPGARFDPFNPPAGGDPRRRGGRRDNNPDIMPPGFGSGGGFFG